MSASHIIFFDSHGYAWETCPSENLNAEAFGPTGIAHILTPEELGVMNLYSVEKTPWEVALEQGRLVRGNPNENEWDTLSEGPALDAAKAAVEQAQAAYNDAWYRACCASPGPALDAAADRRRSKLEDLIRAKERLAALLPAS